MRLAVMGVPNVPIHLQNRAPYPQDLTSIHKSYRWKAALANAVQIINFTERSWI